MEGSSAFKSPCGAATPEGSADQARSKPAPPSADAHKGLVFSASPILDLSQSGLHHLGEIFKAPTLKQLHLQRNALCTIPEDLFQLLPNLTWLDLRHNRIAALPSGIGCHKHLKTLLLERNPIKTLPVELGSVTTLKALNLRHCPLEFPPQPVVQRGLGAILAFLQVCAAERHVSPRNKLVRKMTVSDWPQTLSGSPEDCVSNRDTLGSQEQRGTWLTEKADCFPPVEQLDLSDPARAADPAEGWPSQEEIRRFWKLRQEIVGNEQAAVPEKRLLPAELPPNLRAVLSASQKHLFPRRTKTPSSKGILPNLASSHRALARARLEQNHGPALQGPRDRQAPREQRRGVGDMNVLQPEVGWVLTAVSSDPENILCVFQVASKFPFAAGLIDNEKIPVNLPGKMRQSKEKSLQASQEVSTFHEGNLQEELRRHVQQPREGRSRPRALAPLEETRKAARDLDAARRLQDEVMKLKLRSTLSRDPRCPALSGSHLLGPVASQPQNIFFNPKY
uniref:Leucine rich repeat containing 27 n=1 Tax=Catagonus wagneri TaxID=51154 RepID=A0A8C3WVA9_9CETA